MEDLFPTETAAMFDRTIERLGLTTDYGLAKHLNWPTSKVSMYRSGKRTMDATQMQEYCDKTATPAAEALRAAAADKGRRKRNQTNGSALAA